MNLCLEVGRVYIDDRGERVRITSYDPAWNAGPYPFHGVYEKNGQSTMSCYSKSGDSNTRQRLVAECADSLRMRLEAALAENKKLAARVAELEPKPKVESKWCNLYPSGTGRWFTSRREAGGAIGALGRLAVIRVDITTSPDGKVEHRVELESNDNGDVQNED